VHTELASCTMTIELSQHAQYAQYSQLEKGQIRLLALRQGNNEDEPIECSLSSFNFEDTPPYEALSYFWGFNRDTRAISIHGTTFQVRAGLYNALRRLRQPQTTRLLWVDFICIDQRNQVEIYDQISRLKDVYAKAKSVPIYLGEGAMATDRAMDYLLQIEEGGISQITLGTMDDLILEGLQDILSRPYFQRAWIVQDAFYARAMVLHCGSKAVSSKTIIRAVELLSVKIDPLSQNILDLMPGSKSRREGQASSKIQLWDLLQMFRHAKTTDPRDKIYAVLGMVDFSHSKSVILPDYTMSQEELMQAVIANLCFCEPSCVPDLEVKTMDEFLANLDPIDNVILKKILENSMEINLASLLEYGARYIRIDQSLIEAASRNKTRGKEMADMLLKTIT